METKGFTKGNIFGKYRSETGKYSTVKVAFFSDFVVFLMERGGYGVRSERFASYDAVCDFLVSNGFDPSCKVD